MSEKQKSKNKKIDVDDAFEGEISKKPWKTYLNAELGFRNHWYPAFFSPELAEGECRGEEMLGERVLFKRIDGVVYAVEDRCLHRGVSFSTRPECYTANTITCWYHGFTYNLKDGALVNILTDPESALIGKVSLKTYPVEEHKNVVFVYIGDGEPHPLVEDVQPGFLDDGLAVAPCGHREVIDGNWRLAAENGVDASHIYIHRNSGLLNAGRRAIPLASYFVTREDMVIDDEGGPKGVIKGAGKRVSVWETEIEGVTVSSRYKPDPNAPPSGGTDTSLWLPCGLKVDPFPEPGMVHFEWYVPVDENTHRYMITWGRKVDSEDEAELFYQEVDNYWRDVVVEKFNNEDEMARAAMQRFYTQEDGWNRERLFRPDLVITEWRKLASRYNRGIQKRDFSA